MTLFVRHHSVSKRMLCEKGVLLLILFFARAETQKIESCENYSYKSVKGDNVCK